MLHRPSRRFVLAATTALLTAGTGVAAHAQEKYLGEVMLVGFTFCPRGTAAAEGQLLAINSNQSLFALYGTTYGGDGRTTFALPDLRGRVPVGAGQGPGLSNVRQGQESGAETTTLNVANLPAHSHTLNASSTNGNSDSPVGNVQARKPRTNVYGTGGANAAMSGTSIGITGGGQAFSVRDPYVAMRYCVVTSGIFPSRD